MNDAEIQEKYQQFQTLQQHIEQLTEQIEFLNQQTQEVTASIEAVQQLGHTALQNEFLAPIASGIFVKGKLKENQSLLVNVGANVAVEKTIPQVVTMLTAQKKNIIQKVAEADNILQQLTAEAMKIYQEVDKVD